MKYAEHKKHNIFFAIKDTERTWLDWKALRKIASCYARNPSKLTLLSLHPQSKHIASDSLLKSKAQSIKGIPGLQAQKIESYVSNHFILLLVKKTWKWVTAYSPSCSGWSRSVRTPFSWGKWPIAANWTQWISQTTGHWDMQRKAFRSTCFFISIMRFVASTDYCLIHWY